MKSTIPYGMLSFRRNLRQRRASPVPVVVVRPEQSALTVATVARLAAAVATARPGEVVIDLSGIREWDTDGAAALVDIAETTDRVRIEGLAEATLRMLGVADVAGTPQPLTDDGPSGEVTRLRAMAVYRPQTVAELAARLEPIIAELHRDVTTFVLDLADLPRLDPPALEAAAFGSSLAAVRGDRMLVVNVPGEDLDALRRAGLSAQTWVAPLPLR